MPKKTAVKKARPAKKQPNVAIEHPHSLSPVSELRAIATALSEAEAAFDVPQILSPVNAVQKSAEEIGKSWSGSWLGFESRIYYAGLKPTPPGCYFQSGHSPLSTMMNSAGQWLEYAQGLVEKEILNRAKNPDLVPAGKASRQTALVFEKQKELLLAVLRGVSRGNDDPFFVKLTEDAEALEIPTARHFIASVMPKQITTSLLNPASSGPADAPTPIRISRYAVYSCSVERLRIALAHSPSGVFPPRKNN